jgi:hypothetical protein
MAVNSKEYKDPEMKEPIRMKITNSIFLQFLTIVTN